MVRARRTSPRTSTQQNGDHGDVARRQLVGVNNPEVEDEPEKAETDAKRRLRQSRYAVVDSRQCGGSDDTTRRGVPQIRPVRRASPSTNRIPHAPRAPRSNRVSLRPNTRTSRSDGEKLLIRECVLNHRAHGARAVLSRVPDAPVPNDAYCCLKLPARRYRQSSMLVTHAPLWTSRELASRRHRKGATTRMPGQAVAQLAGRAHRSGLGRTGVRTHSPITRGRGLLPVLVTERTRSL